MTTNEKAEALIEKLGKEPKLGGCSCEHNILIGDVLEAIDKIANVFFHSKIILHWQPLGFTKSLQEIAEMKEEITRASGEIFEGGTSVSIQFGSEGAIKQQKLTPEASELIEFLYNLFFN